VADEISRGKTKWRKIEFIPSQSDIQFCYKQYISLVFLRTSMMPLWVPCSVTSAQDKMSTQNDAPDKSCATSSKSQNVALPPSVALLD
jgi:hypothetical protein